VGHYLPLGGSHLQITMKSENNDYIFYTLRPIREHIFMNDRIFQLVDFFGFEFESRYDATKEPDILDYELSRLMILHEGLPKDNYTLEDFKYKHPLDNTSPVFDGDTYFITNVNK